MNLNFEISFILSQCFCLGAFLLGLTAYLQHEKSDILRTWYFAAFLNTLHFILLPSFWSAQFSALTTVRFLVASRTSSRKILSGTIILTYCPVLIYFPFGDGEILPCLASLAGALGVLQKDTFYLRGFLFVSTSLWAVNNFVLGSPVGVVMETSFLVSNLVGCLRSVKRSVH